MKNERRQSRIVLFTVILLISVFAAIAVTPVSAWSPYTGPKEPTSPSPHHTVIADPIGDTYGTGAVQHDITSFSAYSTAAELIVSVTFAGTISPSDSGQPDAVVGLIDFDTDQDPTTGMPSNVDVHSPYTTGLGVDYFVCLGCDPTTGDTIVGDDTRTEVGRAPVSFTSDSFTVRVPLALIGGDDGIVDTATVLGTFEPTDACPNGGYITSSSPWHEINTKLDALIADVSAADMPDIIKHRLIDKLEYAKALKDNAKIECEAGNFEGATKKLGVAKSQVESFASIVKITRRISKERKASFLADAAAIIEKMDELIEYIETEHKAPVSASTSTASIDVEKWVKYKDEPDTEYRKTIDDAKVSDTLTFKIAIHNDGSTRLTNIWVLDDLECDLGYIEGSASIPPTFYDNWCPIYQEFWWEFPTLWLEPDEFLNITFDAHVEECGDGVNDVYVEAEDATGEYAYDEDTVWVNIPAVPPDLWEAINTKLDALIVNVSAASMPNIIKQRLIDKLEYAKALKENAKIECEAGNFEAAKKKLGVAKNQVESFESMVKITRRIKPEDKEIFLEKSAEIKGKIGELIEYIETEHKC